MVYGHFKADFPVCASVANTTEGLSDGFPKDIKNTEHILEKTVKLTNTWFNLILKVVFGMPMINLHVPLLLCQSIINYSICSIQHVLW